MRKERLPVVLLVLDGWGESLDKFGNAILQAYTPTIDYLTKSYFYTTLNASGIAVGLPWEEPGNSEVGHSTIGSGRVILQHFPRIIKAIQDRSFFSNKSFLKAMDHTRQNHSTLHLVGLLGTGSVHSYIDHLYALLEMAEENNVEQISLHLFTDGQDSPPQEAAFLFRNLSARLKTMPHVRISTVVGRFYAMDRNHNWERTQKAYECMVNGNCPAISDIGATLSEYYQQGLTDQTIPPFKVSAAGTEPLLIASNDAIIFFDYREDRMRQIVESFIFPAMAHFSPQPLDNMVYVTMTQYDEAYPVDVAFPPVPITNTLGEVLSREGLAQLRIAESEKYAHVTYFFNGGTEKPFPHESRVLITSWRTTNLVEHPEMKAADITDRLVLELYKKSFDFAVVNFANADMLGHTGNFEATKKAVEVIDQNIANIVKEVMNINGTVVIVGDHGKAERMINLRTNEVFTGHTTNPVPFLVIHRSLFRENPYDYVMEKNGRPDGILVDVAPTILNFLEIPQPTEMTGHSLL